MNEPLADKSFFKALEVSSLLKIKPHVIRYWETEFSEIRAQKTKDGQRIYRREDVILFSTIKHLLYEKKFTIAGAKKVLRDEAVIFANEQSFSLITHEIYEHNENEDEKTLAILVTLKKSLLELLESLEPAKSYDPWPEWELLKNS